MVSAEAALERLCDPQAEVSAHYLIARDGRLWQLVREQDRAWHAGVGSWCGFADLNSRSIGVELDNRGGEPFAEPQMTALEGLLTGLLARWSIAPRGVIGHSDMAPGRKRDPGPRFDWARLARGGLARPTPVETAEIHEPLETLLVRAGYSGQASVEDRLAAFRLRHRPWGQGAACKADYAILRGLG
jgi:N-acetylmuramoyl-L-alanine amidase